MSKEKIGRIGTDNWMLDRPDALCIFNGAYTENGEPYNGTSPRPWAVIGRGIYEKFTTHAEALAWAFEKAEAGE